MKTIKELESNLDFGHLAAKVVLSGADFLIGMHEQGDEYKFASFPSKLLGEAGLENPLIAERLKDLWSLHSEYGKDYLVVCLMASEPRQHEVRTYSKEFFATLADCREMEERYGLRGLVSSSKYTELIKSALLRQDKAIAVVSFVRHEQHGVAVGQFTKEEAIAACQKDQDRTGEGADEIDKDVLGLGDDEAMVLSVLRGTAEWTVAKRSQFLALGTNPHEPN